MKFLIREKDSGLFFAEPGGGMCLRPSAFVYDTDNFSFMRKGTDLCISNKSDKYPTTWMDVKGHVIIPVGDL